MLFIESAGELYNGTTEHETGTGFLISSDGLALTANHVTFAKKENYKSVKITARQGTRNGPPLAAEFIAPDVDHDLAVLQVKNLSNARHVTLGPSTNNPIGARVDVMGFPLSFDQEIVDGIITSKPSATLWLTNAALNPGHSGAPVFEEAHGTVIGVVTGGATIAKMPDGSTLTVDGIKNFVPLDATTLSAHFKVQSWKSGGIKAHEEAEAADPFSIDVNSALGFPPPPASVHVASRPATLPRTYSISVTKDDHPQLAGSDTRRYALTFAADPGYKITGVERVEINSANHASKVEYVISPDGLQLNVSFTLTSGPMFDRYRGWLDAGIATRQILR